MKKNLIYGILAAGIALILAVGGMMAIPSEDPGASAGATAQTKPSGSVTAAPGSSASATTLPVQTRVTEPSEPATEQTEPSNHHTEPATQPTEPVTLPAEPTTQPTEPVLQPTENKTSGLVFVFWPETISGGETGTVTIQGKPDTAYTIKVYYKSGPSGAKGLEEKVSDADGFVTWTWKVSKNTKPGDFKIVVSGGGDTAEVPFSVLD